jgi:hypothetical protein
MEIKKLFADNLPFQNETTIFILVSALDIFMTYILLRFGAIESNPVANFVFQKWGFQGMIAFKLVIVSIVCVIAQLVATRKPATAQFLLNTGSVLTGSVVIYSVSLFFNKVL